MTLTEIQTFIKDHYEHDLSFESQEFIECLDCSETFELPEGTGVDIDEMDETFITLEVPSGIKSGYVVYHITLADGSVEM